MNGQVTRSTGDPYTSHMREMGMKTAAPPLGDGETRKLDKYW